MKTWTTWLCCTRDKHAQNDSKMLASTQLAYRQKIVEVKEVPVRVRWKRSAKSEEIDSLKKQVNQLLNWLGHKTTDVSQLGSDLPSSLTQARQILQKISSYKNSIPTLEAQKEFIQKHLDVQVKVDGLKDIGASWEKYIKIVRDKDKLLRDHVKKLEEIYQLGMKTKREIQEVKERLEELKLQVEEAAAVVKERCGHEDEIYNLRCQLEDEEDIIITLFQELQTLQEERYSHIEYLQEKLTSVHEQYRDLNTQVQNLQASSTKTSRPSSMLINFQSIQQAFIWLNTCEVMLKDSNQISDGVREVMQTTCQNHLTACQEAKESLDEEERIEYEEQFEALERATNIILHEKDSNAHKNSDTTWHRKFSEWESLARDIELIFSECESTEL